jgi:UDP-glucose:(heptosyl)LPS alpha-1,3-glucosyltransferase
MNIALAIEHFSLKRGGAESYAVQLAERLVEDGWEVHLVGHSWDGHPSAAVFHEIPRLPRWVPPSIRILDFALRHRRIVEQARFDVVLGFGNTLTMNVYQSHGGVHYLSSVRKLEAIRNPVLRLFKKAAMFAAPKYHARAWIESAAFRSRQRPHIVAISDMVRRDVARYFGIPADEIRLVYNGVDSQRFGQAQTGAAKELRKSLGFGAETLFLFMAYDFRKKGVRYLIEAAGLLRDTAGAGRFGVVVAGGPPYPTLLRITRNLRLERTVVFPGATRTPELFYAASDVFILPTFYDACSLVVIEAMAAGLPAITTVFNGAAGIISSGVDGEVLSDPRNTVEMAGAMGRFLDRDLLEAASRAARDKASLHTLDRNHAQMMEIFREVASLDGQER